jgi:hypothetical protein
MRCESVAACGPADFDSAKAGARPLRKSIAQHRDTTKRDKDMKGIFWLGIAAADPRKAGNRGVDTDSAFL